MYNVLVESAGKRIAIRTYSNELKEALLTTLFAYAVLPNTKISSAKAKYHSDFTIVHEAGAHNEVIEDFSNNNLIIRTTSTTHLSVFQLTFIMQALFEKLHQQDKTYGLHAAAVYKGGKAFVILGSAVGGKSSLVLKLCKDHGFRFMGDEKCILANGLGGSVHVVGGNQIMLLRDDYLAKTYPELLQHVRSKLDGSRSYIEPREARIDTFSSSAQVAHFFQIKLSNKSRSNPVSEFDQTLSLFRGFSHYIRSNDAVLVHVNYPLPSLDTAELARKRLQFSKRIATEIPMTEIYGSVNAVAKRIANLASK